MSIPSDSYKRWRASLSRHQTITSASPLNESDDPHTAPSEHAMQLVWLHQRIQRDRLRTLDGKRVQVLHPGFLNRDSGPDFKDAVIRIGLEPPGTVDVEIDREASGWRQHHHATNPHYQDVALHVIWDAPSAPTPPRQQGGPPALAMRDVLDAPLAEILDVLASAPSYAPPGQVGRCSTFLRKLPSDALIELLTQAAVVRLARKAALCTARAHAAGWHQALWEILFVTLGYKPNVWPMRRIAECISEFRTAAPKADSTEAWQARLLGVAGLLPAEITYQRPSTDNYLRRLWDRWWRERDAFAQIQLPKSLWSTRGLRPANRPERRLALAAHWLADPSFIPNIEAWALMDAPPPEAAARLAKLLQPPTDPFWSHHLTLHSKITRAPAALLGNDKVADLAVNAILPWFHARAARDAALRTRIEQRYFSWPASADNQSLRAVRSRLFGGARPEIPRTAAMQQGQLQIMRDFCDHSNALCDHCGFPDLVHSL